jgi:hypothetical protein
MADDAPAPSQAIRNDTKYYSAPGGSDHHDIFDTGGVRLFDQLQKFIDGL